MLLVVGLILGGNTMQKIQCLKCGETYIPRTEKPIRCARCSQKLDRFEMIKSEKKNAKKD